MQPVYISCKKQIHFLLSQIEVENELEKDILPKPSGYIIISNNLDKFLLLNKREA